MKIRSLAAGLALLATGTVIGVTTQQFASADVSSGDRPVLVPIETCRLVDTRENPEFIVGPRTTPLGREETLTVDAQQPGTDCTGLISTDASALSLNVTAPTATEESFITIWADGPRPDASSLNPQPGQLVFNAVTVDLAADQTFRIFNNRGNTNIIVDVNGYYENHNHDDRYYTQTQANDRYYTQTEADGLLAAKADQFDSSDFLAGDSTMVPIARFNLVPFPVFGVDDVEFRAPVTGAPTATWDGTRWVVDIPGQSVNLNFRQALCTAVGSTPIVVSVGSINGDLLVYTHTLAGADVQGAAQCTLYADAP